MKIDTGSSNLAVPAVGCATCGGNQSNFFNPQKSKTFQTMSCSSDDCLVCSPPGISRYLITKIFPEFSSTIKFFENFNFQKKKILYIL